MNSASFTSFMREPFPTFPGTAKEMKRSFSFLFWSAKVAFVDDEKCNLPNFSFFHEAKVYFLQVFTSAMNHSIYLSLGCWNISGNLSPDLVYLSKNICSRSFSNLLISIRLQFSVCQENILNYSYNCILFLSKEIIQEIARQPIQI